MNHANGTNPEWDGNQVAQNVTWNTISAFLRSCNAKKLRHAVETYSNTKKKWMAFQVLVWHL